MAPKITARVTQAPISPFTAGLKPLPVLPAWVPEAALELDPDGWELAHTPVVLPHAVHHCSVEPIANPFIPSAKSLQVKASWPEPNSGYVTGTEAFDVVPLWKRKRTK